MIGLPLGPFGQGGAGAQNRLSNANLRIFLPQQCCSRAAGELAEAFRGLKAGNLDIHRGLQHRDGRRGGL